MLCVGGRNRKVSEAYVTSGKSITELEAEMLNGQKLQGPITALEVNYMLQKKGMEEKYVILGTNRKLQILIFFFFHLISTIDSHCLPPSTIFALANLNQINSLTVYVIIQNICKSMMMVERLFVDK